MAMGLQLANLESQIKVNESIANKNNADARTIDENRPNEVEFTRQSAVKIWMDNVLQDYKNRNNGNEINEVELFRSMELNWSTGFSKDSLSIKEVTNGILKTSAETGNQLAQALLTNEKAKGYWQELANEIMNAKANEKNAEANERKC